MHHNCGTSVIVFLIGQDLIHGAPIGKPAASTASVTAVYAETDSDTEINFTRSIVGSSSEHRVNGKVRMLNSDQVPFTVWSAVKS